MHFDCNLASVHDDGSEFAHVGEDARNEGEPGGLPPAGARSYPARIEFFTVSLP
jgi:hypothetical protein